MKLLVDTISRFLLAKLYLLKTTMFSGIMIGFVLIHTLEDIMLMSIGRFVPLPLFAMYILGLIVSWVIMSWLVHKIGGKHHH